MKEKGLTYKAAGVDIDAANEAKRRIATLARTTFSPLVLSEIGMFGGMVELNLEDYQNPAFIASGDGVGTKLKLATLWGKYDTVGIDLVAHCVNDIAIHGATPLFFLDYIASSRLQPQMVEEIVKGIVEECQNNSCALIGGETAELPGVYMPDEYDLVGFIVGMVDKNKIVDGRNIQAGNILIGLASSGLHTNGYSLVRKVLLELKEYALDAKIDALDCLLIEELMRPHRSYLKTIKALREVIQVKGMAHITGGGMPGNIPRILPTDIGAVINKDAWKVPPIFSLVQKDGGIAEVEMYRTFNMGIGLVVIVSPQDAHNAIEIASKEGISAYIIGETIKSDEKLIKII